MAKIDTTVTFLGRYKIYVEEYKDLLAEYTNTSIEEKTNWITRRNIYIEFIKELEELKKYYAKK